MLEETLYYFNQAADVLDLSDILRKVLQTPLRTVKVEVVTESDSGELLSHIGYRVQHSQARGPMKGGLRFHPTLDEAQSAKRSFERSSWMARNLLALSRRGRTRRCSF